jgi:hypothetical protein
MDLKSNNYSDLKQAIKETIAFFDLFECPLAGFELWQYLPVRCEYSEMLFALPEMKSEGLIVEKNGYWLLPERDEIFETRRDRYNFAVQKFKRAKRAARIFRYLPWIKMIAVGNIIGANNAHQDGDIDLFIITAPGRIWIARFFCAGVAQIFGWRPRPGMEKDRICLSFFLSAAELGLERYKSRPDDVYFHYWLASLFPIYDKGGYYQKLIRANSWIFDYLPNWTPIASSERRIVGANISTFYLDLVEMFFGGLESYVRNWQLKRLPGLLKELLNKDTRVVMNDGILKMHVKDRREEYYLKWKQSVNKSNS